MLYRIKNILGVSLLLLATGCMQSCEQIGDFEKKTFTSIETDYYQMDFNVKPAPKAGFRIFTEEFFNGDISNVMEEAGFNADQVESIQIIEALVNLRETVTFEDFDILKFVELTVYTDELSETRIAWSDPVPADKISLTLDVSDSNVISYFEEDQFMLTVQGLFKESTNAEMKLHAKVKFRVKVRIE